MVKQASKQERKNPLLPIFGLILALTFALVSYLLLPYAQDYLARQGILSGFDPLVSKLMVGGVMWFLMFGVAMFIVSLFAGREADEDVNLKFKKDSVKYKKQMRREKDLKRERRRRMNRNQ
jgi:type III secretory pathway component EscU